MLINNQNRLELESKVLAAAFKQGVDHGDLQSADFAHKALFRLIRERHQPARLIASLAQTVESSLASHIEFSGAASDAASLLPRVPATPEMPTESFAPDNGPSNGQSLAPPAPTAIEPVVAETAVTEAPVTEALVARPETQGEENAGQAVTAPINVYDLLSVPQTSSVEAIHKSFLKQVRKVLVAKTKTKGVYPRKSLEMLRNLWIAHDILTDESIRADYDLNVLGLATVAKPERSKYAEPPQMDEVDAASLRLGELLRAAGLIDQTELEIACDMHKAVREMPFGRFLVKQDFIEDEQLEAVLQGQQFLREGFIDLNQFQQAMVAFTRSAKDLDTILLERGFVSESDLARMKEIIRTEHHGSPAQIADSGTSETADGEGAEASTEVSATPTTADAIEQSEDSELAVNSMPEDENSPADNGHSPDNGDSRNPEPQEVRKKPNFENSSPDTETIEFRLTAFDE